MISKEGQDNKVLVLATRNKGKVLELQELLRGFGLRVLCLSDLEGIPEVVEDGETFFENAMKKARTVSEATGLMALADDSGLEVDALGGRPGVHSARYAGPGADDVANYQKLLDELKGVSDSERNARFRCVMVLYHPSGRWISAEGSCEGQITMEPIGDKGFGYDPVFYLPDRKKTMAQIERSEKNMISHRAKALKALKERLPEFLKAVYGEGGWA